jgi:hypothetical protein
MLTRKKVGIIFVKVLTYVLEYYILLLAITTGAGMNIQHSSRNDDWQTPLLILNMVHQVLGHIDLDPASSDQANINVKAKRFFTKEDNSLEKDWGLSIGTVFINPPGGKINNKSISIEFWKRLMNEKYHNRLLDAIFLSFSIEHLQTSQGKGVPSIKNFPFCVPRKRIAFIDPTGEDRGAPSHSNMIVYVPGLRDRTHKFKEIFSMLGDI